MWMVGVAYLVVLSSVLREMTKKVVNFLRKSAPLEKILATPTFSLELSLFRTFLPA